ncbi:hypothetical protein ABBQ38_012338 [Trebouxia sp. C0009 RCD-2024]
MPHIGQKRRNSIEATCDSSQCAFCYQRAQSGTLASVQTSCSSDSHGSTGASSRLPNEFRTWLQAQGSRVTAHEQIDFAKIGLPSSQVVSPPSKRNRLSLDICEASSSDSSDPSPDTFSTAEQNSSPVPMPAVKTSTPWVWSNDWAEQSNPRPGTLVEVCSFSAPFSRGRSVQHTADIVCGVEFSPDGKFLATAGVAKQVRLYSSGHLHSLGSGYSEKPVTVQRLPSKLSSLAWDHSQQGVVTVGDYDGVVSQMHLESGHFVADLDNHGGQRVWSVAHSQIEPSLGMSTSDDGTARIWSGSAPSKSVEVIRPHPSAPVCDATFCSYDANLVALASADRNAYVYDLRQLTEPLHTLTGHSRAVSYVRFLSGNRLVSSSVDGSLACWDLQNTAGDQVIPHWNGNFSGNAHFRGGKHSGDWRRFVGHKNSKNFVGLAVRPEDGLMACGSETTSVFAYNTHWSAPVAQRDLAVNSNFSWVQPIPAEANSNAVSAASARQKHFVSAVDWMSGACQAQLGFQGGPLLAAAMSTGCVKLLALNQI